MDNITMYAIDLYWSQALQNIHTNKTQEILELIECSN